jgi:hypothetical protein
VSWEKARVADPHNPRNATNTTNWLCMIGCSCDERMSFGAGQS